MLNQTRPDPSSCRLDPVVCLGNRGGQGNRGNQGTQGDRGHRGSQENRGKKAWVFPPLLPLVFALAACGGDREPPELDGPPSEATVVQTPVSGFPAGVTGELEFREGDLTFRACQEDSGVPVTDGTGEDLEAMVEELGYGEGRVTAHLVLEGEVIQELRVAAPEVPSCLELLPEAEIRARGNEPFWLVDVDGDVAIFRSPDELDGVRYDEGSWEATTGGWRFEALRHGVDGVAYLILEVEETRCRDSMSGAWFPYAASLRIGGDPATGCAWEGRR